MGPHAGGARALGPRGRRRRGAAGEPAGHILPPRAHGRPAMAPALRAHGAGRPGSGRRRRGGGAVPTVDAARDAGGAPRLRGGGLLTPERKRGGNSPPRQKKKMNESLVDGDFGPGRALRPTY